MKIRLNSFFANEFLLFLSTALTFFIIRLPFLFFLPGYGSDPDAWRVMNAANQIALSGSYHVSRLPGYPVQEIVCSLFTGVAPVLLNGLSLLFSSFAAAFFCLIIKHFRLTNIFFSGLVLSFTPIVFINSFVTLDYLWALAFILGSLYFILKQKSLTAGIMLGVAIGCRITSGAMCLPLALILIHTDKRNYRGLIIFTVSSLVTGAICFCPVFFKYGIGFFTYTQPGPVSTGALLQRFFHQVWGDIGFYAICGAVLIQTILITKRKAKPMGGLVIIACFISILLYIVCFLKLPDEAAYMIPAIPFVILLLNLFLNRLLFILVCISIAVSPFFTIHKKYAPPFYARYYQRVYRENMINDVSRFINASNEKNVIVCFDWYPFLIVGLDKNTKSKTNLMFSLDKTLLKELQVSGFKVYYIPNKREFTYRKHRMMLKAKGAKPLFD